MRNASKNTIKRVMKIAKYNQDKGLYFSPTLQIDTVDARKGYFLFNSVGAQIYIMSKGNICNRSLAGLSKYYHL